MKKTTLFLICFFCLFSYTQAQWTQVSGLNGGDFRCLTKVGTDIYAGSQYGGVFRSSNNGDTWTPKLSGLPTSVAVTEILEKNTKLFAGTSYWSIQGTGVYRSDDGGETWLQKNNGIFQPEYTFNSTLAKSTNYIFCGTNNAGIYRSNDFGDNWVQVFNPYDPDSNLRAINAVCGNGNVVIAGGISNVTGGSGTYRSLDEGLHWEFFSAGIPSGCIIERLISNGVDFYAQTSHGFYWSPSNGQYWISINSGITKPEDACAISVDGSTIYASTNNSTEGPKTYKSVDGGNSWTVLTSMNSYYTMALFASGNDVFAGHIGSYSYSSNGGGVVRSLDGGATWSNASVGLAGISCNAITSNGTQIFAGTAYYSGIYNSSDNGANWNKSTLSGTANYQFLSMTSSGSTVYVGNYVSSSIGNVYKSVNNGLTWTLVGLINKPVYALGTNATYIFAGTRNDGMRRSTIGGTTWTTINTGLPTVGEKTIRAISVNGSKIYIGTARGVFKSTNDGTNWVAANGGGSSPGFTDIKSLAVKGDTIFAGTPYGIIRSFDNGVTWIKIYPDDIVWALTLDGQNLYAGFGMSNAATTGVLVSSDWGATWTSMNSTFPYTPEVTSLHKVGTKLFAGTSGSTVWSYDLAAPPVKTLSLSSVFLQGLYDGTGIMNQAQGTSGPQWPGKVADHITVELHNSIKYDSVNISVPIPYVIADIELDTLGAATVTIPNNVNTSYYVTIKHRNSIETTSALPVDFSGSTISYAFDIQDKAYGYNLGLFIDDQAAIYGGDSNIDGIVDGSDLSNIGNLAAVAELGYLPEDLNGDGLVDGSDLSIVGNNAAIAITTILP